MHQILLILLTFVNNVNMIFWYVLPYFDFFFNMQINAFIDSSF